MLFVKTSIRLQRDRAGATALEYGLMTALVALGLTAGAAALGARISTSFATVAGAIGGNVSGYGGTVSFQPYLAAGTQAAGAAQGAGSTSAGQSGMTTPTPLPSGPVIAGSTSN